MPRHIRKADTLVAVFARAPEAGAAKTRLIPLLGAEGAASLQNVLIRHTLATATAADIGPVELWCAPSAQHPVLCECIRQYGVDAVTQCEGDLGVRMQHAAAATLAIAQRVLIIGTDCPALTTEDLRNAAAALNGHNDAVLVPAEDGGYALIGLKWWDARLFHDIAWGSAQVVATTRARLTAMRWRWHELAPTWDVDRPSDYERLRSSQLIPNLDQAVHTPILH